ncbi:hypothetical protein [Rhodovulum euryhalinum]|uniref:Uncharacterized protein n=1 Tax=Rhodovulum euryhalinum TaxID=35805 RepID=A0A4R2KHS7_9RHOB|nr:hypothetical protein [Rhodovulum euryhalinum]TCO72002.1 hypothetical protein EV655_105108 [Rhodovulum euryhalinum]
MAQPTAVIYQRDGTSGSEDDSDGLTEFALEMLLSSPEGWRRFARDAAARWPATPPLAIVFALVNASAQIEAIFGEGSPARIAAQSGFRVAGLISADLYAMETLGLPRARAADLTAYWRAHDDYFLTL